MENGKSVDRYRISVILFSQFSNKQKGKQMKKQKIGKNYVKNEKSVLTSLKRKQVALSKKTNGLLDSLIKEDNKTLTQNGAATFKSTLNHVLDFFALGGALRTRGDAEVIQLFSKAFAEDKLLALKCLFDTRNIRSGKGERKTFRTVLKWLGENYPDVVKKNLDNVVKFGRYDDLFVLFGTRSEKIALEFIKIQLEKDCEIYNELV